jgi:3-dehydroquinate dehydratase-1
MIFPQKFPAVVGSVTTPAGLRMLARAKIPADVVEIRADALLAAGVTVERIESALKARRHPVLLTLRIPAEGGHRPWKPAERRALYLRLLPEVEAIDIELASARAMAPVLAAARARRLSLVLSAHALKWPATPAQLARWCGQFTPRPREILKIAAQTPTRADLQRLAAILVARPAWNVAVMGLGTLGAHSRAALAMLGSCLVYGWLDKSAAPGQPAAAAMRKMVSDLPLPAGIPVGPT